MLSEVSPALLLNNSVLYLFEKMVDWFVCFFFFDYTNNRSFEEDPNNVDLSRINN